MSDTFPPFLSSSLPSYYYLFSHCVLYYRLQFSAGRRVRLMNYHFRAVIGAVNGYRSGKGHHKHICLLLVPEFMCEQTRGEMTHIQPYHLLKLSL